MYPGRATDIPMDQYPVCHKQGQNGAEAAIQAVTKGTQPSWGQGLLNRGTGRSNVE